MTTYSYSRKNFRRGSIFVLAVLLGGIAAVLATGLFPTFSKAADWVPGVQPAATTNALGLSGTIRPSGTRFVDGTGAPVFLLGVNYQGNTDRVWQIWDDGKFDPILIDANLNMAENAGLNTVRIFVSKSLRDNINANNWTKLDKMVELAKNHNLRLLITFNDYDEPNLQKEADLNTKVTAHLKGNNTIFGYDLKNEPQFGDVVPADYPTGMVVPLQDQAFITAQGERMTMDEVKTWRTTAQGKSIIPARLDDQRAYYYANAYKMYLAFLDDSSAWVISKSGKIPSTILIQRTARSGSRLSTR